MESRLLRVVFALVVVLMPSCAPRFFAGMDVEDGKGARVSIRGDFGSVPKTMDGSASGGPTSLASGGSRGQRTTAMVEPGVPATIEVGDIKITGPFHASPVVGERMHGAGMLARVYGQVKGLDIISKIFLNRDNQRGMTDRARNASEAANERAGIEAATERARIEAASEAAQ